MALRAGTRYIATRLNGDGTETFLHWAVPLSSVEINDVLSGPPTIDATISREVVGLSASDGTPLIKKWQTAIYAEEEGRITGGGIVSDIVQDGSSLKITIIGFTGYPKGMPYTASKFFVQADPLDIFRHIWAHLQAQPNGNLGLVIDDTKSTKKIGTTLTQVQFDTQAGPVAFEAGPYKLEWFQTHDLGQNIDDLAEQTPFDWHEEHTWNADKTAITHFVRIGFPDLGKRLQGPDAPSFVVGVNVRTLPSITSGSADYANEVMVLGRGEGRVMKRGSAVHDDGRLRRVAVYEDKTQSTVAGANRVANKQLGLRKDLPRVSDILVADHPNAAFGSYHVGDEILIRVPSGWNTFDAWYRILGISRAPDDASASTLTVQRTDTLIS